MLPASCRVSVWRRLAVSKRGYKLNEPLIFANLRYRTGFRWPMNLRKWFKEHSLKLLAIRDTPNAIAGGVAIGIFFGFTPLVGLKTLLSIFFAWLTRCNIVAAAIAVTLHDVALPFMPLLFRWEYDIGYWLLSDPHQWPERLRDLHWRARASARWTNFFFACPPRRVGWGFVSG